MRRPLVAFSTLLVVILSLCRGPSGFVIADSNTSPSVAAMSALRAALTQVVQSQPAGTLSIFYEDLVTRQKIALNAQQSWDPASMIKLFVMADAYAEHANGTLAFSRVITIDDANVVPTAGFNDGQYPGLLPATKVTIDTLVTMMIIQSDTTAYNTLLDIIGGAHITAFVHQLGLSHTTVARKLNLDPDASAEDQRQEHGVQNTTTAADVATFFELLYDDKVPLANDMLHLLAKQKQNYMLPVGLPAGTVMAHKTGEVGDTLRHDAGIAYLPDRGICLLVVFSSLGNYDELSMIAHKVADAYPASSTSKTASHVDRSIPPSAMTAPRPSSLPLFLRMVLLLATLGLVVLLIAVNRGGKPRVPTR